MQIAFGPSTAIVVTAAVLGGLLMAVVPTCLYLYVEPRGRLSWGVTGDQRDSRRAPVMVRFTAWLSFALGQLAIPWLLVPAACAVLLYLQARLGVGRLAGSAATVMLGAMAIVQSVLAARLVPLGVRLLVRDGRIATRIGRVARRNALAQALMLGLGLLASWVMASLPGLVHPWLRVVLSWTALRPIEAYAAMSLVHALMLGRCTVLFTGQTEG